VITILQKPAFYLIITALCVMILTSGCITSPVPEFQNKTSVISCFDEYAEATFLESGVPGMAVVIVENDTVIYLRCFGVANITTQEPVTPDTRFQIASISKSFTSATIASMVGTGDLSWDDRVAKINPEFRLSDPWVSEHTTFRDLLSHRTGLPEYGSDELLEFGYNRSEIISKLKYINLTGEFRSSYAYSNIGITSAAETAAIKAGMSWEDLITERIFVPAGMKNTTARFAEFAAAENHADTYPMINGTVIAGPLVSDEVNGPAGGISSTINDMTRYLRLQLNGGNLDGMQIINSSALNETHTAQNILASGNTGLSAYGFGWDITYKDGRVVVEHGGDLISGVSTYMMFYPNEDMGIVILTNGFPGGYSLKNALKNGWSDLYFKGDVQKDWYSIADGQITAALQPGSSINPDMKLPKAPDTAGPSRELSAYCGTYAQDYYGTIRIEANETGLLMYPGYSMTPVFLTPYDGDTFQDVLTLSGVYFTVGSDGIAAQIHVDTFELPWCSGTFVRTNS